MGYKVGGQGAGGSFAEALNVMDVELNMDKDSADATTRGNAGWKAEIATLRQGSVSFKILFKPSDAFFQALKDVWLGTTSLIGMQILSEPEADGGEGLQGDFEVFKFTKAEPINGVQTVDVEIRLTESDDAPVWIE